MGTSYQHLTSAERTTLMVMLAECQSQSDIARALGRNRSTISRELDRNGARLDRDTSVRDAYDATRAQDRADALAHAPGPKKLAPDSALFSVVQDQLKEGCSPEQIAGILQRTFPDDPKRTVCHETIYSAIYVLPRGELRRELIGSLRQARGKRRPRSRGEDRRGRIADMVSLHVRPPEVEDRLVPGHWEGDLIKGKANKSCVGTLIERSSRLVLLARMEGADAQSALKGFTRALNRVPARMRKTLTYDQGKEMACHKELGAAAGISVYFADPHSPWQRGSNENINGLLRQYLPKGADLSSVSQTELDAIAWKLNTRPRKIFDFRSPVEIFAELFGRR
jgi:transposase, IS30 family